MFLQIGCFLIVGILGHLEGHPVILQGRHKRHPYNSSNTFARGVWKKKLPSVFIWFCNQLSTTSSLKDCSFQRVFPINKKKCFIHPHGFRGRFLRLEFISNQLLDHPAANLSVFWFQSIYIEIMEILTIHNRRNEGLIQDQWWQNKTDLDFLGFPMFNKDKHTHMQIIPWKKNRGWGTWSCRYRHNYKTPPSPMEPLNLNFHALGVRSGSHRAEFCKKKIVWKLNQPSLQSRKPSVSIAPDGFFMGDHFGRNFLQRTIERTKCSPTKKVQQTIQITFLVFPLGLKITGGEGLHGESSWMFCMFHMFFWLGRVPLPCMTTKCISTS